MKTGEYRLKVLVNLHLQVLVLFRAFLGLYVLFTGDKIQVCLMFELPSLDSAAIVNEN